MPSTNDEKRQDSTELQIPADHESERVILGNLMLKFDDRLATCRRYELVVDDFFFDSHRVVYAEMMRHQDEHVDEFDPVSLTGYLKAYGTLERAGGGAAIGMLFDGIARFGGEHTFERHVRTVKEASRKRRLMHNANRTIAEIADGERGAAEIAREIQQLAEDVQKADCSLPMSNSRLLSTVRRNLEERISNPKTGIRCGFDDLDWLLAGLQPGHLCVVAARSRVGKSTFAFQWVLTCIRDGYRPLIMSFEMSAEQIMTRLVMLEGRINGGRFQSGGLSPEEWDRYAAAEKWLDVPALKICDTAPATLQGVASEARRVRDQGGLDLLIIDYLGLMSGRGDNRVAELSEITRGLKLLARDLEIPIIALAQLNRAIEARGNDKPRLSDLRESGSIEQDADQVIFLMRDLDSSEDYTNASLILEKNRHGRSGKAMISFDKRIGGFVQ